MENKTIKTPKIFAKDFKQKTVDYSKLKLPKFTIKFQNFNFGIIVLALQREKIDLIKYNMYSLIICNIALVHYEKQR